MSRRLKFTESSSKTARTRASTEGPLGTPTTRAFGSILDPDRVLDAYPHELSGGMKQRALIELSLILEPDVLVRDEPTAALDLLMQRSIVSLLQDLQETYDLTLVFITHDLPLLTKILDRISVMDAFDIVETAGIDEILYSSSPPYTWALLGTTPNLFEDDDDKAEFPIRQIDVPDPTDLPAGCRFHPHCPKHERCVSANIRVRSGALDDVAAAGRTTATSTGTAR
nr:oligopeptide/dipeptide ABC transporter ATP-binding protein [Halocatena marina]